jgi:hypothetical protein
VERRQVDDVRVVDVPALVPEHGQELLVRVVVDERRVNHDERLFVRSVCRGVEARVVDDVDDRRRDVQGVGALLDEGLDPRKLPVADLHRVSEELVSPDLLEHADGARDGELDGLHPIEGGACLAIGDVGIVVPPSLGPAGAFSLLPRDEMLEIELGCLSHGGGFLVLRS